MNVLLIGSNEAHDLVVRGSFAALVARGVMAGHSQQPL